MAQKYLGITPYDENESFEFVGRTDETWELYDRINRNDYTVYYAASGEGKSSLIRAGLLPILRRRDYFPIYIVFKDNELNDVSSIDKVIEHRIEIEKGRFGVSYEQSTWSKSRFNEEQTEVLMHNLWWKLRNFCFKIKKGDTELELKPLYIFDQFEEVFTKASYEWTDRFFTWLEAISTDYVPETLRETVEDFCLEMPTQKNFKALFSFRTEYLGELDYWCVQKHFIPSLQDNRMCLKPLTVEGAKEVINLNKDILGIYTNQIIKGCSELNSNADNNNPCVYALILSVVCQTLSDLSENERIYLLYELRSNQDNAVDAVLLRFYKKKLKEAGLDIIKDELIIAEIEDALVNENGKRNRRDTNEVSIKPLSKWIQRLCNKDIGVLKIIGSKISDGKTIYTIEFPHDRLCKAIDVSRKERQGKRTWQQKRQAEWMHFGIMTGIVAIIAFLWNTMMEEISSVMSVLMTMSFSKVKELIKDDAEGITTVVLMLLLLFVVPVQVFSLSRKNIGWMAGGLIGSVLGSILIASGYFYYTGINYSNKFIPFIQLLLFIICLAFSVFIIVKISDVRKKGVVYKKSEEQISVWPLYGGICIFLCYIFYECLTRLTIGVNEPIDSAWCIVVIPIFFGLTILNLLNMKADKHKLNRKMTFTCWALFIIGLVILYIINSIPKLMFWGNEKHNDAVVLWLDVKQDIGFSISLLSLLVCSTAIGFLFYNTVSKSKFYNLGKGKKVGAIIVTNAIIIITYILNLGYNPICISPSKVCHVANWRSVIVCSKDSLGNKEYLGMVDPISGEEIIPCCINISDEYYARMNKGEYPFKNDFIVKRKYISSPFENGEVKNIDESLIVDRLTDSISGLFTASPVYEEYLYKTQKRKIKEESSLNDKIDICAANLYYELRKKNLKYLLTGNKYGIKDLTYIEMLDSLQYIAFCEKTNELEKLKDSISYAKFEDIHLVGFYRELSRTMLISQIRDRISQKDVASLFTLSRTFPLVFFNHVDGCKFGFSCDFTQSIDSTICKQNIYKINSEELNNNRLFSWYQLFDVMCNNDIVFNTKRFQNKLTKDIWSKFEPIIGEIDKTELEILKQLKERSIDKRCEKLFRRAEESISHKRKLQSEMNTIDVTNINIADSRFNEITRGAINISLYLINSNHNAHYNNAFENTIQNLILVSRMRGHEIKDYTDSFECYSNKKSNFYEGIIKAEIKGYDMFSKEIELIKNQTQETHHQYMKFIKDLDKAQKTQETYHQYMKIIKDLDEAQKLLEEIKNKN